MRARRLLLALVLPAVLSCGGDDPIGPEGEADGFMTARIEGTVWQSDPIYVNLGAQTTGPGIYSIQGTEVSGTDAVSILISLMNIPGPGTYPLGTAGGVSGGSGSIGGPSGGAWGTPLSGAAGTITIATLSDTRIAGTFSFNAEATGGGATGSRAVTAGTFDLPLARLGNLSEVPPQSMNRVSATVDGAPWNAAVVTLQQNVETLWGFVAGNTDRTISIGVQDFDGVGTYPVSNVVPLRMMQVYGPGGVLDTSVDCCWTTLDGGGVGSVTVETWSETRATGTFAFTLPAEEGTVATDSIVVTNGTFDIGVPE